MNQLQTGPDFDGETYDRALDHKRLTGQLGKVYDAMSDHGWYTLAQLRRKTDAPEASISARMRDLRKKKFGGHTVSSIRLSTNGLWWYKLQPKATEVSV